ncbi:hypothetical protein ACP3TJ_10855 [Desulforudis sp. 1088]|uniref:hypothetical protein n=1 Tax=unclassified Candidatus Desulforudis TaxID=2635950 RepID=UPI0034941BCC
MQKRICPQCKTAWYSADTRGVWICAYCHAEIPVPETANADQPRKAPGGKPVQK